MEFLVKLLGIGVAFGSLSAYTQEPITLHPSRIAQIVLMAIAGGGLTALIVHRVLDKEIFALGFLIFHTVGHWIMVIITGLAKDPSAFLFTYAFLMILGEYVKMMFVFLADTIEVRFFNKYMLYGISGGFILLYIGVIIAQVVIWLIEYPN